MLYDNSVLILVCSYVLKVNANMPNSHIDVECHTLSVALSFVWSWYRWCSTQKT